MSKNNRARRTANAKRRAAERASRNARSNRTTASNGNPLPPGDPLLTTQELVEGLLELAASPWPDHNERAAFAIERLFTLDRAMVCREAERQVLLRIGAVWNGGWQPVELARHFLRATNSVVTRLSRVAIAADHARRQAVTLDPRWIDQLDRLDLPRVESSTDWLVGWGAQEQAPWPEVVEGVLTLLRCLASLSRLPTLIPPPGTRAAAETPIDLRSRTNDPMLDRVRALLAQAESTTFDAEAEAFTAKAQELMTRHAIDLAMVSASAQRSEQPLTNRVPIDDPYVDAKSLLLHHVALHSRCRSVFHQPFAMSSVTGFADDVAATEMLFTSLLVQAQAAMHHAAASAPAGARARSRSFRSAFLVAYAERIGERLAEINAGVIDRAVAETSSSILPVLAARSSAVDDAVDEMFGTLRRAPVKGGYDAAGWTSGHLAAGRARLNFGDLSTSEHSPTNPRTLSR